MSLQVRAIIVTFAGMIISVISSSPRPVSLSYRVAKHLHELLGIQTGHTIQLIDVRDWTEKWDPGQPVYQSVDGTPDVLKPLASQMFATDAFVLVSPEYNGGPSYSLKKLFDHFPKQSHKVFGLVTSSDGGFGGMRAALHLQQYVAGLFGILSPHMMIVAKAHEKFDEAGNLTDAAFQKSMDNFVKEFLWLADKIID